MLINRSSICLAWVGYGYVFSQGLEGMIHLPLKYKITSRDMTPYPVSYPHSSTAFPLPVLNKAEIQVTQRILHNVATYQIMSHTDNTLSVGQYGSQYRGSGTILVYETSSPHPPASSCYSIAYPTHNRKQLPKHSTCSVSHGWGQLPHLWRESLRLHSLQLYSHSLHA